MPSFYFDGISSLLDSGDLCWKASWELTNNKPSEKPMPKKIIWNNPYTTVLWEDGTKTIVRAMDIDNFDQEIGFAMCLMRKVYGGRSTYQTIMEKVGYRELTKEEKKALRDKRKGKGA